MSCFGQARSLPVQKHPSSADESAEFAGRRLAIIAYCTVCKASCGTLRADRLVSMILKLQGLQY